jgi:phenylacetate-CoA ligase
VILLEHLRKIGFWSLDFMRGGNVLRHKKDIQFIIENFHSEKSKKLKANYLKELLGHAVKTVPYYKDFNKNLELNNFPVLNKFDLRKNFNELQSNVNYKNKFEITSSGSTGTTSTTIQDKNKKDRNTADTIYFKQKAGFEVGHRIYYIRRWFEVHKKSKCSAWLQNIKKVDVSSFNDKYIQSFIDDIVKDNSNKTILSYSSALRDVSNYIERTGAKPLNSNIACIIAMSESIGQKTVNSLEKHFNTKVLSRYSNLENGLFGLQLPNQGSPYHINWASYYIEILDINKDIAVKDGELGRVVITDYFNFAMPIIRYDTGDLASFTKNNENFNKAKAFSKVEGRVMDMIRDTEGKPVSSFIIFHLESYPQIQQFQLIHSKPKEYILKLVTEGDFNADDELIKLYKSYLGEDAVIKIERVLKIPYLPSGKRRLTVDKTS